MYGIFTQMFHKMYRKFGVNIENMDPMGVHAVLTLISCDSLSDGELQWTRQDTLSQQMLSIHPQGLRNPTFYNRKYLDCSVLILIDYRKCTFSNNQYIHI